MLDALSLLSPGQNFFFRRSENLFVGDDGDGGNGDNGDDGEEGDSQLRNPGSRGELRLLLELGFRILKMSLASTPRCSWPNGNLIPAIEPNDGLLVMRVVGVPVLESPMLWYPSSFGVGLHSDGFFWLFCTFGTF